MSRTIRTIIGVILILTITFSTISICQNIGLKIDVTEQSLYTLSQGTKSILAKLNQPITAKLYFAKTAALQGPDQIRFFSNYYEFVKVLLEEYASVAKGMVKLEIIDPRPFSTEEEDAIRYGLKKFPITQEENFFFGLVVVTQFGVEKTIPFFSPDRQNFLEYDISYLIDTAITRQKKVVGVMSSIAIMGDDVTGYMAQMMAMQGQKPKPSWVIIDHLKQQFEVKQIATDVNDINDIDILLVVHPKELPEETEFAIDQFVLRGGRTILCIDPYCYVDRPARSPMGMMGMQPPTDQSSNLPRLLKAWGLEMPANTFAGDTNLAMLAAAGVNQRPQRLIGYLGMVPGCFNEDSVITAQLNSVKMVFAGTLKLLSGAGDANEPALSHMPLVQTTAEGNSWKISGPFELQFLDPERLRQKFVPGSEPVTMGYLISGRFKSAFPEGISVDVEQTDPNDPNETITVAQQQTGLTESSEEGVVVVYSDTDFISDSQAYQNSFFGKMVVGDNSALLINTLEELCGSNDLISIRSRGNFRRPFEVVDEIERKAEEETAAEVEKLKAEIAGHNQKLQSLVASAQEEGNTEVIGSTIIQQRRALEIKVHQAQSQLKVVQLKRREAIENLGNLLQQRNMLAAPAVILVIGMLLGIRRSLRKRHYISHASDA
ncbi:MAG: Gldg family protein [Planctomycetes bacterium]|nr:Gldg family protein [Planctomycetota bacterium]